MSAHAYAMSPYERRPQVRIRLQHAGRAYKQPSPWRGPLLLLVVVALGLGAVGVLLVRLVLGWR